MRSSASEMPSGTPGLRALTGGLLMVMIAMSLSFVSCTRSVMERILLFDSLRCFRGDVAGVDHRRGDALAMKCGVSECRFRCLRSTVIQMNVVFPSESHTAVDLDAAIADRAAGIAGVHLGYGNGGGCVRGFFFQRPSGIVHGRTGTLGFQIHVRTMVLDGLKRYDRFGALLASLRILHRDVERPLHTAD